MNNTLFQQAKTAMAAGGIEDALRLYTQCLLDESAPLAQGEPGLIYHQIGNCLTKLGDYNGAIEAYTQAAADSAYDAVGTINCNLGMSYAALNDFDNAVKHFEIAVSDRNYATPYKAYSAMGNALLKQGKSAEAGVAFREAALDEANPDPTKALLNLGVCFMALNRPADAVASYESALQFDMKPATRNKLNASLGQAYVASGQMQKAVDAFDAAIADKTYFLSASASVDYQRAIAAVSQGTADETQALPAVAGADMSGLDIVDSYPEGGMGQGGLAPDADGVFNADSYYYADSYGEQAYEGSEDRFFNASDEEIEQWSRGISKEERKRKGTGLKIFLAIVIVIVVLAAAAVVLYTQGWGYPTAQSVAQELFTNTEQAKSNSFISTLGASEIEEMVALVPEGGNATVDGVDAGMSASTAYVTVNTAKGGEVKYKVSLVRDLIGWKISNVEMYFNSTN